MSNTTGRWSCITFMRCISSSKMLLFDQENYLILIAISWKIDVIARKNMEKKPLEPVWHLDFWFGFIRPHATVIYHCIGIDGPKLWFSFNSTWFVHIFFSFIRCSSESEWSDYSKSNRQVMSQHNGYEYRFYHYQHAIEWNVPTSNIISSHSKSTLNCNS